MGRTQTWGKVGWAEASSVGRRSGFRLGDETVLALADCLRPRDRILVEQVYRDGRPLIELARVARCNPQTLRSRLDEIVKHLHGKPFRYVLACEQDLPRELQPVARRRILERRTLRETARLTRLSLHEVRRCETRLQALIDLGVSPTDLQSAR